MRHLRLILFYTLFPLLCGAQLVRVPIIRKGDMQKKNSSTRTQSLSAMQLPFWDDFSFNNSHYYPSDTMWTYGQSVWVNNGMGINAPSLNVATFDGLDSLGKPYSVNDVLAKGYADKLISRPLRMDLVTGTQRDSVYIFFMYQFQGNGEPPDPGDELTLWFKDETGAWTNVWSITENATSNDSVFIPIKIPITESKYFFESFQFQFKNFGRLSGPFDGWNLDYVYVSNGKKQYSPIFSDFPDRTIATPMTSLFKQYRSIPTKHFLENPTSLLTNPSFKVGNMRLDLDQPIGFNSRYKIASRVSKVVTVSDTITLDLGADTKIVKSGGTGILSTIQLPDVTGIDPKADSIAIKFEIKANSGDNRVKKQTVTNIGDYDSLVYKNIDFRHNDTTSTNFILRNYYAYDDGTGEYAATLTYPGNKVLYRYDLKYSQPDTLVAVDIYFTHSGDESNQVVKLLVTDSLSDDLNFSLLQQDVVVTRTEKSKFTRVNLGEAILVRDHFYIGWRQNTNSTIGVGVDYSSDSGDKIFVNFTGAWIPNQDVHGNLMIRPVFGNGKVQVVSGLEQGEQTHSYPNPNRGNFFLPMEASQIFITDVTGKQISFHQEFCNEAIEIRLASSNAGMYVLRYLEGTQWRTEKIMVLP
jgi:hypothetical protein